MAKTGRHTIPAGLVVHTISNSLWTRAGNAHTMPGKRPRAYLDQEEEEDEVLDDLGCVLEGTRAEDAKQVC